MARKKTRATEVEFRRHEVLERALTASAVVETIMDHSSLIDRVGNKDFTPEQIAHIRNLVHSAENALNGIYRYVGEIHLGEDA